MEPPTSSISSAKGVPQIEVTFDIDANGIVSVKAKDKATGKEQSITITGGSSLSDAEIEAAVNEAERFAEEDNSKREVIDAQNKLNTLIYQAEKFARENEEFDLNEDIAAAKEADGSDDVNTLTVAIENLESALHASAAEMYQNPPEDQEDTSDEDIIDAEIVE